MSYRPRPRPCHSARRPAEPGRRRVRPRAGGRGSRPQGGHQARRKPGDRRPARAPGGDRRRRGPLHRVSLGGPRVLAPDEARDADLHALRRHQPAPRGALPARRAPPAHVLSGPRRQLELAAPLGGLHRLHQGQGRRRVRPDPQARRRERRHHPALARRPLAERPRPLVAPGRPHGLRLDPAQRIRPRRLRDGPEGRGLRADGARGEGRRLVRFRLVARRQEARGVRGDLGQRELPLARRRRHGREDARHPERRLRAGGLRRRAPSAPTARGCT